MPVIEIERVKPQLEEFLTRLLKLAGLKLQFRIQASSNHSADPDAPDVTVDFSGPDTDVLLQRGGELLEALEDLTIRVLRLPPFDRGRISFDSMDYKTLRVEELRLTAETAAEAVLRTGTMFSLNPMNSRDRRVIHLALKENHAVRTESQGFGPYRKVVIFPSEKK